MALFSKRHYEWLAHWAGAHLGETATQELANSLTSTSPAFKKERFLEVAREVRSMRVYEPRGLDEAYRSEQLRGFREAVRLHFDEE